MGPVEILKNCLQREITASWIRILLERSRWNYYGVSLFIFRNTILVCSWIQNNIVCSDCFSFDCFEMLCYDRYFSMKFRRTSRCGTVALALYSGANHSWELRRFLSNKIGVFTLARKHKIIWSCQWSLGIEFFFFSVKTRMGKIILNSHKRRQLGPKKLGPNEYLQLQMYLRMCYRNYFSIRPFLVISLITPKQ